MKTEIDPTGGTSYTINGTSQLLSVPYSIYANKAGNGLSPGVTLGDMQYWNGTSWVLLSAGSTGQTLKVNSSNIPTWQTESNFGGKTYIIISGAITDAQAATKLSAELGPNTQFIWIENTTALTTLDLSGATNLLELKITSNNALINVNLNNLTFINKEFKCEFNPQLNSIPMPNLVSLEAFNLVSNSVLTSLSFPVLTIISGAFNCNSNPLLNNLAFPVLTTATYFSVFNNTVLNAISFPLLNSAINVFIGNSNLTNLSMPLYVLGGLQCNGNPNLISISLPLYQSGTFNCTFNLSLTSLSLPSYLSGIFICQYTSLTSLLLPLYSSGSVNCNSNSSLSTISFPSLESTNFVFSLQSNALPTTVINSFLVQLSSIISGIAPATTLRFNSQVPPAPPTGSGLTAKASLLAAGFTVLTD